MFNRRRSRVYALTVPPVLLSLFSNLSCKIAKNPTRLHVHFKNAKDGEIIKIILENEHINGIEINLERVWH